MINCFLSAVIHLWQFETKQIGIFPTIIKREKTHFYFHSTKQTVLRKKNPDPYILLNEWLKDSVPLKIIRNNNQMSFKLISAFEAQVLILEEEDVGCGIEVAFLREKTVVCAVTYNKGVQVEVLEELILQKKLVDEVSLVQIEKWALFFQEKLLDSFVLKTKKPSNSLSLSFKVIIGITDKSIFLIEGIYLQLNQESQLFNYSYKLAPYKEKKQTQKVEAESIQTETCELCKEKFPLQQGKEVQKQDIIAYLREKVRPFRSFTKQQYLVCFSCYSQI